ncbi:MAG: FAD-binding oxidoreductase [Gammaproteobacteria bacterium]|nr:FAD-binding oxidoreductase [Gammaproteobacteria bacterium]
MIHVDSKPADLGESGWNTILPPRQANPALESEIDCDYLVVGAGFAGLSAARRIAQLEPLASIVILESQQVATGPAGRNSGFMIDLPHALATGRYAGDNSQDLRNIRMNRAAIAFAADCARSLDFPDEAFDPSGKINAAADNHGLRHNISYARHLEALGEPFELLDAAAMRAICGSHYYQGGLKTPGTAILQPALYIRSLADALVKQSDCQLFENSALQSLSRKGERWLATTATGSVTANRVILAVNGLIETFGFYRHRLMHINLYASMTRQLSREEVDALGGERRWGFTPSDPIGSTVRRIDGSGGTRLVIRNRCSYEPGLSLPDDRLQGIVREHDRTFRARFPMLKQVEMEYCWSGRLCLSRNDVWALGELEPGLFSACCQNGLGTTRGTIAGIVTAEMATGSSDQSLVPDYVPETIPQRLFPEPFMTLGARTVIRFKEWRAGKEL